MQGEFWSRVQELNKTPLSLECKKLAKSPSPDRLYLLQALEEALEEWKPEGDRRIMTTSYNTAETMKDLLDYVLPHRVRNPERIYKLLTTSKELPEEMSDSVLLEKIKQEKDPEGRLWALLDNVECNLEDNGYNLSGENPVTD